MTTPPIATLNAPHATGKQIASWGHLLGFLLIMTGTAALGFRAQQSGTGTGAGATAGQLADHGKAIYVYLAAGSMDWALLYYCWVGVHRHGGNLGALSGGRWMSWTGLAADVAIALPFWVLWEATAYAVHWVLGPSSAKSVADLLPRRYPMCGRGRVESRRAARLPESRQVPGLVPAPGTRRSDGG